MKLPLSNRAWKLCGWRPYAWQIGRSMELGMTLHCDISEMPATFPGSVQASLLAAGLIKDWNDGRNSLACEWVEHRHWEFITDIPVNTMAAGEDATLHAETLDHSGWVLVDGRVVATFSGSLTRQKIGLGKALSDGKAHMLSIVFDTPPEEQGQVGFTSRSRHFKPRYNFSWDFCPRFVPIGASGDLWLEFGAPAAELIRVTPRLRDDLATGEVEVRLNGIRADAVATARLSLDGREVVSASLALVKGENVLRLETRSPDLWWPNGHGAQTLHDLVVESNDGAEIARTRVGFKHVAWEPCEGAPEGATPWICVVNGRRIFLQGVNWTPVRLDYLSVTAEDYRRRVMLYRDMGCNVLRVWGGGFLETKMFYDLCDEAGLMVWQEFPLSSSGIDNYAPEDAEAITRLAGIARDYMRRRGHHASRLLWCGGNELQHAEGRKDGAGIPLTLEHPCLAALNRVVAEEDPGTRFLPTSSSGPRFMAFEKDYGKGLHHDVHGPWNVETIEKWRLYWAGDDALLRSETGAPGAASLACIEKHRGDENPWPPDATNRLYLHACSWWLQWDKFKKQLEGLPEREALARYVELSQALQAEALAVAAAACRGRFPRCGGVLLWMGHDLFPCPINTSVIDFDATPKAAYHAVRAEFLKQPGA